MAFFAQKKKSILGIDIGSGGMKLVELKSEKNRPVLHTYGYFERPAEDIEKNQLEDAKVAAEFFKKVMKAARTTTLRAVAALPIASVFSSIISVPAVKGKEFRQAIEWQARKLIPLPLEEMVLHWKFIGNGDKKNQLTHGFIKTEAAQPLFGKSEKPIGPPILGQKTFRILLSSAPKTVVSQYVNFAKACGLELAALETEAFGLIRSLVGKDPSNIMIVDFGSLRTSIIIVEQGIPVQTRSINLGGIAITRAIARALGIAEKDAEQMKRDVSKLTALGGGQNAEMPALLAKTVEPLATEIHFSINLYKNAQGNNTKQIDKIILTGGSSHLPYLATHLSKILNVNTYIGDPWARVGTHEDLRQKLDEIGPRLAVAVGLAMSEFE